MRVGPGGAGGKPKSSLFISYLSQRGRDGARVGQVVHFARQPPRRAPGVGRQVVQLGLGGLAELCGQGGPPGGGFPAQGGDQRGRADK